MVDTINTTKVHETDNGKLNLYYMICEVLVAVFAVVGNAMVILVFRRERKLRRRTNYYIVSLAAADFLVGLLGIPFAILASVGLPANLYACLFTVSLLVVLCTISIFCLVAVSVDRYWAILHPMGYSRNVRTKTALVIIGICWFAGSVIGFLPLMGWYNNDAQYNQKCYFLRVVDMNYLVFLYFGTIITPALLLAAFYAHIYRVVLKQLRQIVTISPTHGTTTNGRTSGGTMLRMLGAAQKREVKATQNLSIIVLFFMICWIPLYTVNCVIAFCSDCEINETFMLLCIILSHANSAGNPILYAYHLKDFREALKNLFFSILGRSASSNPTIRASYTYNNNFNHCRMYSFQDSRVNRFQNKRYIESPIHFNRTTKSMSLPTPPKLLSIVSNSVTLAAATVDKNRDIWKISEDPSNISNESSGIQTHPSSPFKLKQHSTSTNSSNSKNRSYLNDINYDEDDDVFLDDTIPITEIKKEPIKDELSKIKEQPIIASLRQTLSSSSPQLSTRNVYLVETELKRYEKNAKITITKENNGDINCRKRLKLSSENTSPSKSLKSTSPFKAVSELWNSKFQRSASLSDESTLSPDFKKRKKKEIVRGNNSLGR
nr:histamine H2 receptor [Onthophagus taurus]